MKILVINSGSSSIKYRLFGAALQRALAAGVVERIGEASSFARHKRFADDGSAQEYSEECAIPDHGAGLQWVVARLLDPTWGAIEQSGEITAVGHRVVHGGERFREPTFIDQQVCEAIRTLSTLAPLHNPANLAGIDVAARLFPEAKQIAVFDTAFHQTMPPQAYRYAIPQRYYDEFAIRSYGFHGTSHRYVCSEAISYLGAPAAATNLISVHLGNGCSIAAVRGGQSVDTSMGFSPLAGLIMGTRSGDIDPAVPFFLGTTAGMSFAEIDKLLNKQSGLLGIAGSNDVRDIERRYVAGDELAKLALEMYAYRIRKYVGAYLAVLGTTQAIVFTAGVGENSALVRQLVCEGLAGLGIVLDQERNNAGVQAPVTEIQAHESRVKLLIIPADEELEIARQVRGFLS